MRSELHRYSAWLVWRGVVSRWSSHRVKMRNSKNEDISSYILSSECFSLDSPTLLLRWSCISNSNYILNYAFYLPHARTHSDRYLRTAFYRSDAKELNLHIQWLGYVETTFLRWRDPAEGRSPTGGCLSNTLCWISSSHGWMRWREDEESIQISLLQCYRARCCCLCLCICHTYLKFIFLVYYENYFIISLSLFYFWNLSESFRKSR